MSTTVLPGDLSRRGDATAEDAINSVLWRCIYALASLKLTCVLFLLGMFIVFVGSLAQARKDVWLVVGEYFRTYVAWIDVPDFFPPSMFPGLIDFDWNSLGVFRRLPFPGGWTIGWIMLANLTTAHVLRFKIRVRGGRLVTGIGTVALGMALTAAVVITGNQQTGVEYGDSVMSPENIWYLMLGVLGVASVVPLAAATIRSGLSKSERILLGSIGVIIGGVLAYFVIGGESARLNLSSMRILWQLLKGTACAVVMLIGCYMLFEKRGGIVLLHIGVALLMFSELQVGFTAKETMLALMEGQKSDFLRDMRERELAVVLRQKDGNESVVAIPEKMLLNADSQKDAKERQIDVESLPFIIRVDKFYRNSQLTPLLPGDDPAASSGLGTFAAPLEVDPVNGMDDSHDSSSLQIAVLDRTSGKELNTLLLNQDVSEMRKVPIAEQVTSDGKDYQFFLRFQRNYKDFEVELLDVSRTNYIGTATPRDYRSKIVIRDAKTGAAEEFTLWMNNPLRYRGETFYQSGYNEASDGTEMTTLSVVRNTGWMLPYIACMIVAVGMFAQFGQTLSRYLSRLDRASSGTSTDHTASSVSNPALVALPAALLRPANTTSQPAMNEDTSEQAGRSTWLTMVPAFILVLSAAWLMSKARPPRQDPAAMDLYGFAQLPVAWKGRDQPIDSFARTELLMASHKSTFTGELSASELDMDEKRKELLGKISKYFPSVDIAELETFSGEYSEWIEKVMKLSSSGREAVEDRLRSTMVTKMPAVRWFLDIIARPQLAARHRVIKIDDDQVLSLLGLEKRAGLTYSVEEIQQNIKELETINRDGLKLEMAKQEHKMTQLQRRVVALVRTTSRVDSLQNTFLVSDSQGLLDSLVRAWWVMDRLGDSQAIMAVPTGSDNEQRSWETLIGAGALRNVVQELKRYGLTDSAQVKDFIQKKLPRELVSRSLEGSVTILKSSVEEAAKAAGASPEADAVQKRAATAASSESMNDPFLKQVLSIIAKAAPGATADQMLQNVTDKEIEAVATERISSEVFQVFQELTEKENDPRLAAIRRRLQATDSRDEVSLAAQMNSELISIVLQDLEERAGELLFRSGGSEVFAKSTDSMIGIMAAWRTGNVQEFNGQLADYRAFLKEQPLPHVNTGVVSFEAFFNYFEPFMKAIYLYLPVLIMSFLSWIVWPLTMRRTGFWLMGLAFAIHTVALLMRMYISGRPPVTNLYSSSIFIGWAVVGAAFVVERILKNGIGNILGSAVGMATLMIAHYLARDEGDTLGVMQAVLDTTFWLATHVVCITLGYAATFLAGVMAIAYCVMTFTGSAKSRSELPKLGSMIYGVLCFAVFFSLVGTVLGGLWADDSWGRFWGWDPKENGAMLIVMWNAVILHARWDKMVRAYGTAVLAMFGNIVTAWSWFGVNELKAGLHTYGFTEGRLLALMIFIGLQLIIIVGAMIPVIGKSANKRIESAI